LNAHSQLRILWVCWYPPFPPHSGGQLRAFNLLAQLLRDGHHIDLWCISRAAPAWPADSEGDITIRHFAQRASEDGVVNRVKSAISLQPLNGWALRTPECLQAIEKISASDYDVCVLEHANCASLLPELTATGIPLVLDAHNVEWRLLAGLGRHSKRWRKRIQRRVDALKMRRLEGRIVAQADSVVAVSQADQEDLEQFAPRIPISICPNGVDTAYYHWRDHTRNQSDSLLFVGAMTYSPNVDACLWLASELMPLIRQDIPSCHIRIVGGPVAPEIAELHSPDQGIDVVGHVPDIRPYLESADLCFIPMRAGSGTRLKALEALAAGVPVVATPLAIEGLHLGGDGLALTGETPVQLVEAVIRGLSDTETRRRLSADGRRHVAEHFEWVQIATMFEHILSSTAEGRARVTEVPLALGH
jgi:glycosyltransferase involved in cell wall biosynthesis